MTDDDDKKKPRIPEYPLRRRTPVAGTPASEPAATKPEQPPSTEPQKPGIDLWADAPGPETAGADILPATELLAPSAVEDVADTEEAGPHAPHTEEAAGGAPATEEAIADAPPTDQDAVRAPEPDEPILPPSFSETQLVDAVGSPTRRKKDKRKRDDYDFDEPRAKATRRTVAIAALAIIGGLACVGLIFLGRANAQRFLIACTSESITPEQGRSFPPWGEKPLRGAEWKPIALPPNAECKPRETDDRGELERWYLDVLLDRASTTLAAKNLLELPSTKGGPNPLDLAADQLNQALLLSRSPDRRDQRKDVERLLGDVQYWRAAAKLRDASAALADAAKQFDAASAQRPRHVTDAAAWGTFLHRLVDDVKAGPNGQPATSTEPATEHVAAPMGSALPVEPQGSASEPTQVAPDAGVPSGGVLL